MKSLIFVFAFLTFNISSSQSKTDDLKRRADVKAKMKFNAPSILITSVPTTSTEYKNGLRDNDLIIKIDNNNITTNDQYLKLIRGLRSNRKYTFLVNRNGYIKTIELTFQPKQKEVVKELDIDYQSFITNYGYKIRTVVTKPKSPRTTKKLPAILFVQWLSCSSVESRGSNHGFSNLIWELSKSGYLVQRTEKFGVGDSEGPDCSELDFTTEVNIHREALEQLKLRDDIDLENIIILGGSMGSNIAAILASENKDLKALIFAGGYYKSWHERLLDFERRRMEYSNEKPEEVYSKMKLYSEFYAMCFSEKLKPSEILKKKPHLLPVWPSESNLQYGRPIEFYWQVNDTNMGKVWSAVSQPILALYGEYDWVMDKEDSQRIIEKSSNPNSKLITLTKTDHNLYFYRDSASAKEGFNNRSTIPNKDIPAQIIHWLDELMLQ
ncbi:alpha/beta fold hydrolase [uncultured Psychroserpens sp.]|uniref:alpha/beta fold hydrolase n=1 Tax=uncultured Psychroserpens sp. TaxID=255436 RepID=UPI00261EBD92|nr:alpha/beta fold hydrolase [uncultured Psychroserpens sp.]